MSAGTPLPPFALATLAVAVAATPGSSQRVVELGKDRTLPDTLLLAAHGPDARTFVVVGGDGERDPAVLWRTTDGGRTFRVAAMPVVGARLYDVCFADRRVGFACGLASVVLRTGDAGATWQRVDVPVTNAWFASVQFVDAEHGVVAGGADGRALLLRTEDGGANWQRIDLPGAEASRNVRDVCLLDDATGFACGENGHLWRTGDGGRSWRRIDLGTTSWLRHLSFPDRGHGFVVAADGAVFGSADGGENWQARGSVPGDKANSICFVDPQRGYLATMGGGLYRTVDGGATFERIAAAAGAITDLSAPGGQLLVVGQGVCRFLE